MRRVNIVLNPPVLPMLAKRVSELPLGDGWIFEPKWDGFRALVFRDGEEILIQSRDDKALNRYFPDLMEPLKAALPQQCVVDGEIVIVKKSGLDFEQLQMRIHPAASRVSALAKESPAAIVFFDVLCEGERDLRGERFDKRRRILEEMLEKAMPPVHITPASKNAGLAEHWFKTFEGAGLDGVMAKPMAGIYEANKRVMYKVKHVRDCDCVVAGFRWHKQGDQTQVGSLLLGLYDQAGTLQHVGVCSSFSTARRSELLEFLAPYRTDALKDHPWKQFAAEGLRMPGGQSRWSRGKNLSWEPLRIELVAEVEYDHMQGDRFRHVAQFRRWRADKRPAECTYGQLEIVPPQEIFEIFGMPD